MEYKYGRRGHAPRCDCPDCNGSFREHNRDKFCGCIDCTYHREIHAADPPMVPQHFAPYREHFARTGETVTVVPQPKQEAKRVAGINICEREGCEAFIKGAALSYVDLMPNTTPGTEREVKELCPACMEDVYNLLRTAPVTDRARGYSKPYDPKQSIVDDSLDSASDEQVAANLFQRMMRKAQRELEGRKSVDGSEA